MGAGHRHDEVPPNHGRAFLIGIVLNTLFVAVEVVYGLLAHSMALLGDAGHNLSDVLALAVAWGAATLAQRKPSARRTYGMGRASILSALFNALTLLVITGAVAWESVQRLLSPVPVASGTVIVVAGIGVFVNSISAWFFMAGQKNDLNLRAAFIHLATDAAVSGGVVLTGILIHFTGWMWLDAVASLLLCVAIVATTWGLLRQSMNLALDAVPAHLDPDEIMTFLLAHEGVQDVHDLHVWPMSTTETVLTAHLVMKDPAANPACVHAIAEDLHRRFGIGHTTLQLEPVSGNVPCALAGADRV